YPKTFLKIFYHMFVMSAVSTMSTMMPTMSMTVVVIFVFFMSMFVMTMHIFMFMIMMLMTVMFLFLMLIMIMMVMFFMLIVVFLILFFFFVFVCYVYSYLLVHDYDVDDCVVFVPHVDYDYDGHVLYAYCGCVDSLHFLCYSLLLLLWYGYLDEFPIIFCIIHPSIHTISYYTP